MLNLRNILPLGLAIGAGIFISKSSDPDQIVSRLPTNQPPPSRFIYPEACTC
jgi:hypothetical protein